MQISRPVIAVLGYSPASVSALSSWLADLGARPVLCADASSLPRDAAGIAADYRFDAAGGLATVQPVVERTGLPVVVLAAEPTPEDLRVAWRSGIRLVRVPGAVEGALRELIGHAGAELAAAA